MSLINNMCDFCHADIIENRGLDLKTEYFCQYKCYDRKYSLENEDEI